MKLSKVLFGSAVMAALMFGFVSCAAEDDDELNLISGSGNNYSVSYTNTESSNIRGYDTTATKHRGALTQITFNKDSLDCNGAMAFIWDLESNSGRAVKDPRVFNIAGLRIVKNGSNYYAQPYVSVYKNITDIQEVNLGADSGNLAEGSAAKETEILSLSTANQFSVTPDSTTGAVTVTINAYEETDTDFNNKTTYTGNYIVDFYAGAVGKDALESSKAEKSKKITYEQMGYKAYDSTASDKTNMLASDNRLPQKTNAVYANVYTGKTLNGTYKFIDTYSDAEVVEE